MKQTMRKLGAMLLALTMLLSALPLVAVTAAEYPTITPGVEVTFDLNETVTEAIYAFTPAESGVYRFYTYDSSYDTYGYLLNANGDVLAEDDDSANSGNNFLIAHEMTAGTTYLLKAQFYTAGNVGSITLLLEKAAAPTAITIDQGDAYTAYPVANDQFRYTLEPAGAATVSVTWSVSDPSVIELMDDGYVRFLAPGTATVTATTAEGLTDTCEVTVLEPLPLKAGETVTGSCDLHYKVCYSFVPEKTATYAFFTESEQFVPYAELRYTIKKDLMVLDYDEDQQDHEFRLQRELTAGEEYYLYVSGQLLEATFDITAEEVVPATAMTLNHTAFDGYLGSGVRLRPVYTPQNAIYETLTWESSDDTVASVTAQGMVSFLKEGTATVTATSESGFTASCEITVGGYPTISLCKTEAVNIYVGGNEATYLFTPETSGNYAFYAASEYDTVGYIYDAAGETLLYNGDDYYDDRDFRVEATLEAGVTYQLRGAFYYSAQVGSIDLTMVRIDGDGNVIHDVSEYVVTDDSHSGVCDGCGEAVSEAHSCDENGLCVCGHLHIHTGAEYDYDDTDHWYTCACGDAVQEAHSPDADGNCVCGWFAHDHAVDLFYDATYHWGDCTVCYQYISEEHTYDENGNCICGFYAHEHIEDVYEYDDSGHWFVCGQCGLGDSGWEEHSYDEYGECVCGDVLVYGVQIGDVFIESGEYLDLNGNITDEKPSGGYAYYEDGVLTLHDFSYTGWGSDQSDTNCLVYAETELELVLEGNNRLHSLYGDGIYVNGADLTVRGDGSLAIKADGDFDGIDVNGGRLEIESGTLNIEATDHGIEVYGKLRVNGGTVTVVAGDDGFDVDGDVRISGGVIDIHAEDNGIDGYENVTVNGGTITIRTNDDNGIETDGDITVNGGELDIDANDECLYAEGTLAVNGGELALTAGAGDAAMMAGTDIVFDETMGTFETVTDEYNYIVLVDENGNTAQSATVTSVDTVSLKAEWITLSQTAGAYTGAVHTPAVTVTDGDGNTLTKDTDYTLSWSAESIKDSGTYTVTVTGIGAYSGTKLKTYTVYEDVVYVDGVMLTNGDYLANGAAEATTSAPAEGGYAHYADSVLTLKDFTFTSGYMYNETGGGTASVFALNDLTVELVGANKSLITQDGIVTYGDLVIGGKGSLTIEGEFGICANNGNVTVNSGTLDITATDDAIKAYNDVNIHGGTLVIAAGDGGIYADNAVNIRGGTLTLLDAEAGGEDYYSGTGIYTEGGDLSIGGGTIVIDTEYGLYTLDGSILISGGSVDITAQDGIYADYNDIAISGGVVTVNADYGIYTYYDLYVEGGLVEVTSTEYAVRADGTIHLAGRVSITLPENGFVAEQTDGWYIADEDGNIACHVRIEDEVTIGDITGDGNINTMDALLLYKAAAGGGSLTATQMRVADINGDGSINTFDALLLYKTASGM